MPLKTLFSVIFPSLATSLPSCSLLLSFFLDLFFPLFTSTHVPSTASSLVHTINIYLSVNLCALHSNVLYCLSLSPRVSYKLTNTSSTCSCQLLKLNKKPGVVHFSAVKHPGACRLKYLMPVEGIRVEQMRMQLPLEKRKHKTISRNNAC